MTSQVQVLASLLIGAIVLMLMLVVTASWSDVPAEEFFTWSVPTSFAVSIIVTICAKQLMSGRRG